MLCGRQRATLDPRIERVDVGHCYTCPPIRSETISLLSATARATTTQPAAAAAIAIPRATSVRGLRLELFAALTTVSDVLYTNVEAARRQRWDY